MLVESSAVPLIATCAFGIESTVKYELTQLGYEAGVVSPGRVQFAGDLSAIVRANLWLRTADRVLLLIHRFDAPDFDALFETSRSLPWEAWIPADGQFPVTGRSRKSQLTSVPAVQRAVKRAIVDRLLKAHGASELPETGPRYGVEIALLDDQATLTIDTTGPSLHKRGYRRSSGLAPLKETLASALIQLSFWSAGRPLIDPFCGSGTIPIEAAMLGRNIAPGLTREFSADDWPQIESQMWSDLRQQGRAAQTGPLPVRIIGTDLNPRSLIKARDHASQAGVADDIHFQERSFHQLSSNRDFGCIITNPPYGIRIGERSEVESLHRSIPEVLRSLPSWSHFILTAYPNFEKLIQKQADRRRKLYNGRIECTFYQFHGPKPGTIDPPRRADSAAASSSSDADRDAPRLTTHSQVFGGITTKAREQAELFGSRLRKRSRHFRRWPTKQEIYCYRLYDRDIPEIPLVVERYEDHLHLTEYERPHERNLGQHADWLDLMMRTAGETLEVESSKVFIKTKLPQRGSRQHERRDGGGYVITAREGGLKFWINLSDYVDTGLFLDHRITRSMVRDAALDKRVLNLFAYTGAFSAYAADGGARGVTTVDWSPTYLDWSRRNMDLNGFRGSEFQFIQRDVREFVTDWSADEPFDLVVVDPPTFSNSKRTEQDWDVGRDHGPLLMNLLSHVTPGGQIFFSTNSRRFKLTSEELPAASIREISRQTVPDDFRNRRIHRCWLIQK